MKLKKKKSCILLSGYGLLIWVSVYIGDNLLWELCIGTRFHTHGSSSLCYGAKGNHASRQREWVGVSIDNENTDLWKGEKKHRTINHHVILYLSLSPSVFFCSIHVYMCIVRMLLLLPWTASSNNEWKMTYRQLWRVRTQGVIKSPMLTLYIYMYNMHMYMLRHYPKTNVHIPI